MDGPGSSFFRFGRLPPALTAILVLQLVWGAGFIARTSFELGGRRHFVLFDDATISMAYAKHAVEGSGLVWSPEEEPVEGFTNPLWTGVMAAVHLLPLPPRLMALPIQLLSLALLLVHTVLLHRLARRFFTPGHPRAALLPAALSAFYVPLAYWSLVGMETALQAVLVTSAVLLALEIVRQDRDRWIALGTLLALGYLTRMDMLVPAIVILAWTAAFGGGHGRRTLRPRRAALAVGILAAAILGYQAFRTAYFGDPLPNTYYLKLTGIPLTVRWLQGLATFGDFVRTHAVALVLVLGGTAFLLKRRPAVQLPALLFIAGCAYSVYVGGDAWEPAYFPERGGIRANRFLAYLMPQVFLLAGGVLDARLGSDPHPLGPPLPSSGEGEAAKARLHRLAAVLGIALVFSSVNGLLPGARMQDNWRDFLVTRPPLMVPEHRSILRDWRALQRIAEPGASVAVFWAGLPAYFNPGYRLVDVAGYTDRETAKRPAFLPLDVTTYEHYRPGHVKFDYPHLLDHVRPDVFFQTYPLEEDFKRRLLTAAGYGNVAGYWVREDSGRITRPPEAAGWFPPNG